MAEKSKNFRSVYYDKVGFRGAEEKKAFQILINEKPIDRHKLSKFCLNFSLSPISREYVWTILLGVLPTNPDYHDSILEHRIRHYEDLVQPLRVMRKVNEKTPKAILHTLMYLMIHDTLMFAEEKQLSDSKALIALAGFFIEFSSSVEMSFWLFRKFTLCLREFEYTSDIVMENIEMILKKKDESLLEHLKQVNAFGNLPFMLWFDNCFVNILHKDSMEKICDKIIGGSHRILFYVAASMLLVQRASLLLMDKSDDMTKLLEENSEETSDIIVNKAMDMM